MVRSWKKVVVVVFSVIGFAVVNDFFDVFIFVPITMIIIIKRFFVLDDGELNYFESEGCYYYYYCCCS